MNINGYNPYKKGFDLLAADIQEHEARCVTPSACEPFSTKLSAEGVNRLGDTIADMRMEVARLRVIEAAAVACSEHPVWNDDQFYGLMTELQRALRGEVGADKTANDRVVGPNDKGEQTPACGRSARTPGCAAGGDE